ncbi:sensor histidine kinase [Micromonospora sp. URMC 103]|uniref:sensor histidine kinase n=1 Tax=Micromonospora sp. URMC 103 TaxID=3423406 RepID=UPI003F1A8DA2
MNSATWGFRPPRVRATVATAVSTAGIGLIIASSLWAATRSASPAFVRVDVALAVASVAVVPLIMFRPVTGGVLASLLMALSPVATPAAGFAVLFTAQHRPFRRAAAVALVSIASAAVQGMWRPVRGLPYGWWLLLMAAALGAVLGWGTWARARHALFEALHDRARRAEQEQERRVTEARAAERNRIAREMHDVLAHRLSLLAAAAGAMEYRPDAPPERLSAAAGVIRASARQALSELREVVAVLRSDDPDARADEPPGQGLADVSRLVGEARAAGQSVEVDDSLAPPLEIPPMTGRTAYRIVQEALTNARKHADGQPVTLALSGAPGSGLTIAVRNPARSDAVDGGDAGSGLIGLAERAALAGGRVTHHVDDDSVFHLDGWLPWPA